jgi:hypothetical protein
MSRIAPQGLLRAYRSVRGYLWVARGGPFSPDNFVSAAWCVRLGMYVPITRASLSHDGHAAVVPDKSCCCCRQDYWWISASLHCCNMPVHARCLMGPSVCIQRQSTWGCMLCTMILTPLLLCTNCTAKATDGCLLGVMRASM